MSHADEVTKLAKGFKVIAKTETSKFSIIENSSKKILWYSISSRSNSYRIEEKTILKKLCF